MAYLSDFFKNLFNYHRRKPGTNLEQRVSWLLRPYASTIQDIVMWKDARITLMIMAIVNLFLWLTRCICLRPLGLISGIILLLVVLDGMATALGAGKRPLRERGIARNHNGEQLMRATLRARQWLSVTCANMLQLRQENPSKFCVITCSSMVALWVVAYLGGAILVHIAINLLFFSPLFTSIRSMLHSIQSQADSDGEVEEFLPELSKCALEELNRAGDIQDNSAFNSLGTVDLSLPSDSSILYAAAEAESSDDEDYLEPKKSPNIYPSIPLTESSSDSESEFIPKGIAKGNMTYENTPDEMDATVRLITSAVMENVVRNIRPTTVNNEVPKAKEAPSADGWVPYLVNTAGSYLKYPWSASQKQSHESDSDEFELIDKNDL